MVKSAQLVYIVNGEAGFGDGIVTGGTAGGASAITVLTDGSVSVGTTSTVIVPAQPGRTSVLIVNTGTAVIYLKAGGLATTSSMPINPGASYVAEHTLAISAVVALGIGTVYVTSEGRSS